MREARDVVGGWASTRAPETCSSMQLLISSCPPTAAPMWRLMAFTIELS